MDKEDKFLHQNFLEYQQLSQSESNIINLLKNILEIPNHKDKLYIEQVNISILIKDVYDLSTKGMFNLAKEVKIIFFGNEINSYDITRSVYN